MVVDDEVEVDEVVDDEVVEVDDEAEVWIRG
jgi:hypothetical protein